MALSDWPLYEAVYRRLTGADGVSAAAASYEWAAENEDPALPFGRVEPLFATDDSSKQTDSTQPVVQVDVFAEDGRTAREMLSAADTALRAGSGLAYSYDLTGFAVIGRPERIDYGAVPEPTDEAAERVRHLYARYRFRTQHTG